MHIIHKKRTVRFVVFFVMMLMFAIFEDVLAAHFSGAEIVVETLPLIIVIATVFTIITELVEEHFERGEQPLEHVFRVIMHLEKHNVPPTPEGIKRHLEDDAVQVANVAARLKKKKVPLTYENLRKHLRADVDYLKYETQKLRKNKV